MNIQAHIRGLEAAQRVNANRIARLQPNGDLGAAIRDIGLYAQRIAMQVTHRDTGTLSASHRVGFAPNGESGLPTSRVFISPTAINPRSKTRPTEYGIYEHRRGGSHAFYTLTRGSAESYARTRARALTNIVVRGV